MPEARRNVGSQILVPLLKTVVFLDVVEVVPLDDDSSLHLQTGHNPCQNTATNAHISSEWALLVDVGAFDGLWRDRESACMSLQST